MKILHIVISRGWHAQVANAYMIISRQKLLSYNLHVITLQNSKLLEKLSVEYPSLPITTFKHYNSPKLALIISKIIKREPFDAVHLHGYNGKFRLNIAKWTSFSDIPIICSCRDQLKNGAGVFRFIWKQFSRVVVPNKLVMKSVINEINSELPIQIIAPPVNIERFIPAIKVDSEVIKIGMFARFDVIKGYPYFFEACQLISQDVPKSRFIVAVPNFNSHESELNYLIRKYEIADRVTVLGNLPNIENEINKLDIGVIASLGSEELSRIALEYMACGIPIVSTDVGGLPEWITREVGILVPSHSASQLADGIKKLIADKKLRRKMGINGRNKVLSDHSIQVHCNALQECYALQY